MLERAAPARAAGRRRKIMLAEDSTRTETALLERIAAGDREAFAELYDRYSRPLYAFVLRIVSAPADAEDVLQEVFVQIWERAAQFDEQQGKPFSWAVAMTRNKAIDRLRSLQRRSRLAEQALEAGAVATEISPHEAHSALPTDESARIRSALGNLPDDQRRAIEMAFFGGLTHHQVAEALREPLGTVKARIRRGMLRLREALEETA